ncbi:MAG: Hsp33 family molecular chaperone HslO [Ruminococcaceae bacterium]|nr:Hsp33 family molecular chaperone HslO [Oscillospiraceae bacterium]
MADKLTKAVTKNGLIRIYAVNSKNIAEAARKFHSTMPLGTAALGRLLTGAVLMGNMQKDEDISLTLQLHGDGPLGRVLAVANSKGEVKGYIEHPLADLPLNRFGKLDVGGGIGKGYLSVVKDMNMKEPYIGQVPIQTGEIGDDIAFYFAQSEQIASLVALGVLVDRDYSVKQAGGFIVQIMPDCDEFNLKKFEKSAESITSVTQMLEKGLSNEELIREVMKEFEVEILEETDVYYHCDCSDDRMQRAIISLGKKEIQDIIDEQGEAEIVCQFCNKAYTYGEESLEEMRDKANR